MLLQLLDRVTIGSLDLGTADGVHKDLHACACHCVGSISRFPSFVLMAGQATKKIIPGGVPPRPPFSDL